MEQIKVNRLVLAFDCASSIGSVALVRDTEVISRSDTASENPSRAEEVLVSIQRTLERSGHSLADVTAVAVGTGPGSYSGIRIGLATAAGFATALGIEWYGVPLLEALSLKSESERFAAAMPIGKGDIAWQEFSSVDVIAVPTGKERQLVEERFSEQLLSSTAEEIVVPASLIERSRDLLPTRMAAIDAGDNLAELVAAYAVKYPERTSRIPLYLRNEAYSKTGF